ncbi:MAG: glycosyltransferase family 4 protein [Verrucomicrobiaceae bacterium]|nr:glycosyltransferase family 4 protein [Verrucomicrobiaceae bacterium]
MRLLLSAVSCCPNYGSEPGVGWNTVREAAVDSENEVHVLVAAPWKERLERNFDSSRHPNVHFHLVSVPGFDSLMAEGKGTPLVSAFHYVLWQFWSYFAAVRLHQRLSFDLVHHVTFVKFNTFSLLPLLGIPFIWGPLGGAEHASASFYREFGWKTRAVEWLRRLLQWIAPVQPLLRWTAKHAALAIGVTQDTVTALRSLGARRIDLFPAVGLNDEELALIQPATHLEGKIGLTVIYAGRLIPWKGVHLALRALAGSGCANVRFQIIGSGPLRQRLEQEAHQLGISDRVSFLGEVDRATLLAAYASAEGFLYPSLHDSGGNAVIEAMAAGLPVIHLAKGGPDLLVPEEAGYKVQADDPETAVCGLTQALQRFCANRSERVQRGNKAREHAFAAHSWKSRGIKLREIYASLAIK